MASAGLNFDALTPSNGAVQELNELLFLRVLGSERLSQIFNMIYGAVNGKKVGFVGQFGLVGKASTGCNPTYGHSVLAASEKTWELGSWEVSEEICYSDLFGTLAQTALKKGVDIADLTGTEYLDDIIYPRIELAIYKMLMRLAWFADPEADTVENGGILTNGTDKGFFTPTKGFWARLFEIVAADESRRTVIDANAQTTFATQKSAILAKGAATGVLDRLIMDASGELRTAANQVIYITQSLKDALAYDIQHNNIGSDLQWKSIFTGVQEAEYQGIRLVALPEWDNIIQNYEKTETAWNKPHRALYTATDNLLVGVDGYDDFSELRVFFDQKTKLNYLYSTGMLGTIIGQDNMVQVAY